MIEDGDLVSWDGIIPNALVTSPENYIALSVDKLYTVKKHWNNDEWCALEEIEHYGYPRSMFSKVICVFEDVLTNVV